MLWACKIFCHQSLIKKILHTAKHFPTLAAPSFFLLQSDEQTGLHVPGLGSEIHCVCVCPPQDFWMFLLVALWCWVFDWGSLEWISPDKALVPVRGSHSGSCLLNHFPDELNHISQECTGPNQCPVWPRHVGETLKGTKRELPIRSFFWGVFWLPAAYNCSI